MRLVGRDDDDGRCPPFRLPLGGEGGGASALRLARVGACADELRLMGVERDEVSIGVGRAGRDEGSLSRKSARACGPPAMERIWRGPRGGRRELDDAILGERWTSKGSALFPSGALSGHEEE